MGISIIAAARNFYGQAQGKLCEDPTPAFENFDNPALIKTYNTNIQVPDCAGRAGSIDGKLYRFYKQRAQ